MRTWLARINTMKRNWTKNRSTALWSSAGLKRLSKLIGSLCVLILLGSLACNIEFNLHLSKFDASKLYQGYSNSSYAAFILSSFGLTGAPNGTRPLRKFSQYLSDNPEKSESDDEDAINELQFQFYDSIWQQTSKDKSTPSGITAIVNNQFLVDTPGCKIPDFSPFHPSVKAYLAKPPLIDCKPINEDLTSASGNILYFHPEKFVINPSSFIKNPTSPSLKYDQGGDKFNQTLSTSSIPEKRSATATELLEKVQLIEQNATNATKVHELKCCYKSIERVVPSENNTSPGSDGRFQIGEECYPITEKQTIINFDCIVVYCNSSETIYTNVHYFIQKNEPRLLFLGNQDQNNTETQFRNESSNEKNNLRQEILSAKKFDSQSQDRLSVIIFGTDSVSRLNFIRKLPKTYSYLMESLGALEFKGFNKQGDNTFPNLVPVLTGYSSDELKNHSCLSSPGAKSFHKCPWIWKEFKKKGHITAFMEDSPWMGIFNYNNPGFMVPPTDFYARPYFLASEKLIGKVHKGNSNVCQGSKFSIQVLHNYSLEFMKAYPSDPTFSLFWSASITHDFVNFASLADVPHLTYLKSLEESGALNKSVLIFMSDHGMRWGKLRRTQIGAFEDRLPFFFMVFPKWFRKRYSIAYSNLKRNTQKLISNYDIHETLLDLVSKKYEKLEHIKFTTGINSRGISLFREISDNRTCTDAGIPPHFCTCQVMKEINKNDYSVMKARNFIKDFLNKELKPYPNCSLFTDTSIVSSHMSLWNGQRHTSSSASQEPPFRTLFLQIKLDPGEALVEATIKDDSFLYNQLPFEILGEISRINQYSNQSHCISHDVLRKFCICKDSLVEATEINSVKLPL